MKRTLVLLIFSIVAYTPLAWADTFGTGDKQFPIDFVIISGDASGANGANISQFSPGDSRSRSFTDPGHYRIGKFEITNAQWNQFKSYYGIVTGNPSYAYLTNSYYTGETVPTNKISWYEAAQFVNWLNVSTGHQAAYKFTGTKGTSNYTLGVWKPTEAWEGTNLYRHKDSYYFLPTEDEWVKAAYWNGTNLQTYATKAGDLLYQGNGSNGGWNYYDGDVGPDGPAEGPWAVGSGSEELNGTFDMMGNVWEWLESPFYAGNYIYNTSRGVRGGWCSSFLDDGFFRSDNRGYNEPYVELKYVGFRVASVVPEPATIVLLCMGGLMIRRRRV